MQTQTKTTENMKPTSFTAKDLTFEGMAPKQTRVQKYAELKAKGISDGHTSIETFSQGKEPVNYSTRVERKRFQKKNGIKFGKETFQMIVTTVADSSIAVVNTMKSKSYTFKGKHSISRKK
ncbi:hypothetical protein bcgnr5372_40760 [Bacillus luti]|nr:hypothetical protein [Bacillus cereus]HDR8329053.1 hypothetical protein [Bacillus cereus]HDR8335807.1 hypothetical protein [Bacillus cereus]